jgi:V8-like Glu-specific endopeptidase
MKSSLKTVRLGFAASIAVCGLLSAEAFGQQSVVSSAGGVTTVTSTGRQSQAAIVAMIANAQAMPLPQNPIRPSSQLDALLQQSTIDWSAPPESSPGGQGTGVQTPVELPIGVNSAIDNLSEEVDSGIVPQEYGTANHPYTTARVDTKLNGNVVKTKPYRAAGKLYFSDPVTGGSYVCSASLIKPGLLVTAAHCVAAFGESRFYANWLYVPAQYDNIAPYGVWNGGAATILSSYYNGTDSCAVPGVVCQNDVAVIQISPQASSYPGDQTGWFGYAVNGYGFTPTNIALINQLGYPVSHDSGLRMQRTDSQGFVDASASNNTVWGSRQTGGSSGGPELVNLGIRGKLTTPVGSEAAQNKVVGVTSWGYTDPAVKEQGASPFTSGNITVLVNAVCGNPVTNPACL